MAETTADVRRDIEMTRERMTDTLQQLEQKLNVMQIVRDHPWPALAAAFGAGVLLSGSGADVKAAAATATATKGASGRVGTVLDDVVANLVTGVSAAFASRVDELVNELKSAIGAPAGTRPGSSGVGASGRDYATAGTTGAAGSGGSFGATGGNSGGAVSGQQPRGAGYNTGASFGTSAEALGADRSHDIGSARAD